MRLANLLSEQRIEHSSAPRSKMDVLSHLAGLLARNLPSPTESVIHEALSERERLATTGVGSGVAIPHGRLAGLERSRMAVLVHPEGVPFDAVDGRPVRIFFALISPHQLAAEHLACLAKISRLLREEEGRRRLRGTQNAAEVLSFVAGEEGRSTLLSPASRVREGLSALECRAL